jgi:hypothetical protein
MPTSTFILTCPRHTPKGGLGIPQIHFAAMDPGLLPESIAISAFYDPVFTYLFRTGGAVSSGDSSLTSTGTG